MAWLKKQWRLNGETGTKGNYWSINWRTELGKTRQRGLGFLKKRDAQRLLKIHEANALLGRPVEPQTTPPGSSPRAEAEPARGSTLGEFFDRTHLPYVRRDKSVRTWQTRCERAAAVKALIGDVPLAEVRFTTVEDYVEARLQKVRSRTVILELLLIRAALEHASVRDEISSVPKLPSISDRDKKPHKFLSEEDSCKLIDALRPIAVQPHTVTRGRPPITRDKLTYLAVFMALNTGMRRGELMTRRWEHVRWDLGPHGSILVCAVDEVSFKPKMRRDRVIPLTPQLRAALEEAHAERTTSWLFPSPKDPSRPRKTFIKSLKAACRRAGLVEIHPHSLRHTWAARLASAGVPRRALMDLGGWKSSSVLDEIYSHTTDNQLAAIMADTGIGHVAEIPTNKPAKSRDAAQQCGTAKTSALAGCVRGAR